MISVSFFEIILNNHSQKEALQIIINVSRNNPKTRYKAINL